MKMVKKCKLQPIPITLQITLWSIRQVSLKGDVISNIVILFADLRQTLCFSSSIFRYHFEFFFLEQLQVFFNKNVRTVTVQKWNISYDIYGCLH